MRPKLIRAATVPSSLNTFCYGFLSELSKEYDVIALSSSGPEIESIRKREGVRCVEIRMERQISLFRDICSLVKIFLFLLKEKPQIIHSITPKAGFLCMSAAYMARVPIRIHTFTGLVWPTSKGIKRRILMMTDKVICHCATHIIPEGEGVKRDLLSGKITKKPLEVLGYGNIRGIDLDYYDRKPEVIEQALRIREAGVFTFIYVGRIVADKGINELVLAFERLYSIHSDIRLVLVGRMESNLNPINTHSLKSIKSSTAIQYVGPQNDVRPWYVASDCFVFPSYREGFPNTVIEAGALSLPSIVTDINGSREIISSGFNGIVVPARDSNSLFFAMEKIYSDRLLREEMARNARPYVSERYELNFVRKCQIDYYHKVQNK